MITTETPTEDGTYLFCGLSNRSGSWQDMQSRLHPQLIRVVNHDGMRLYASGSEYIDPKRLVGAWQRVDVYAMTTNLQQSMVSDLLDLAVERGFVVESEGAGGGKLYAWRTA